MECQLSFSPEFGDQDLLAILSPSLSLGIIGLTSAFKCCCKSGVGVDIHLDADVDVAWRLARFWL